MAIEGDVNASSTTNVRSDGGKKNSKGKKHQKNNEEMLLDPTPSEVLTSHPPSTTEASDNDLGEEAIDVTAGEEWVTRVEVARQAVEVLGRRMNVADENGRYPHWSPIKFKFSPRSPTLRGGKGLPNKGNSVPKEARTRDLFVKDEGVHITPPQPLLVNKP
ncbi:hypothetical protein H5410_030217 [Solanum commersonii]|uniref:Uncharacterized protein n=1 Tax=Solanum commersonii TaxID=4109 RepID=A0A9J5YG80_SOLCO|nr:hypothetical protein H5410_030217 [Solanum commersonii]